MPNTQCIDPRPNDGDDEGERGCNDTVEAGHVNSEPEGNSSETAVRAASSGIHTISPKARPGVPTIQRRINEKIARKKEVRKKEVSDAAKANLHMMARLKTPSMRMAKKIGGHSSSRPSENAKMDKPNTLDGRKADSMEVGALQSERGWNVWGAIKCKEDSKSASPRHGDTGSNQGQVTRQRKDTSVLDQTDNSGANLPETVPAEERVPEIFLALTKADAASFVEESSVPCAFVPGGMEGRSAANSLENNDSEGPVLFHPTAAPGAFHVPGRGLSQSSMSIHGGIGQDDKDSVDTEGPPILEATLVTPQEDKELVVTVAIEERLVCGINFADRRVRLCIAFVFIAFVVFAVTIGIGVASNGGASAGAIYAPNNGTPSSLSWIQVGEDITSWKGSLLGSVVSLSSNGTRLVAAYGASTCSYTRKRMLRDGQSQQTCFGENITAEVLALVEDLKGKGRYYWRQLGEIYLGGSSEDPERTYASVSMSGLGNRIGVVTSSKAFVYDMSAICFPYSWPTCTILDTGPESWHEMPLMTTISTPFVPSREFKSFKIALSGDGKRAVIGESNYFEHNAWFPYSFNNATRGGRISIFEEGSQEDGKQEEQYFLLQTSKMDSTNEYNMFGNAMALSADGSVVAFGAARVWPIEPTGDDYIFVKVYHHRDGSWSLLGKDIGLKEAYIFTEQSIALSADGYTIAIGTSGWDEQRRDDCLNETIHHCTDGAGRVRVFRYNSQSDSWLQIGNSITPNYWLDLLGSSVSLSDDGTILAAGGPQERDGGKARMYKLNGTTWHSIGNNTSGFYSTAEENIENHGHGVFGSPGESSGASVSLSGDGDTVAIGIPRNRNERGKEAQEAGAVRIYTLSK